MKRHLFTLGLLLSVPAFAENTTTASSQEAHRPPHERKSPVQLLLEHRQDLALSDTQAAGLERIQAALEVKNAPLMQSLEALKPARPPGDGTRPQGPPPASGTQEDATRRANREQAHGLFDQLRTNVTQAYQEAEQLLTDAQKTQARTLLQAEMAAHRPGHGGRGGPPPGE
ncbi:hypothetical protein D7Y13_39215 [Corallococcus praedator]|uniref:Periplasmic heavy metal sensor n=1 Tax=Corallococcus praedator TaxID=2316724 RepID=A0ABX9Q515_9BACT|nr:MULTISPECIES: Spy/CpxP family protein refolding chaperone [Corallococcus]RKH30134.1 hypothetical protein D7X75_21725 [Corallococcus sp. CA031C]RKH91031.1 hypothetical protein D7Y13_39215 [Corallococcus praedator]